MRHPRHSLFTFDVLTFLMGQLQNAKIGGNCKPNGAYHKSTLCDCLTCIKRSMRINKFIQLSVFFDPPKNWISDMQVALLLLLVVGTVGVHCQQVCRPFILVCISFCGTQHNYNYDIFVVFVYGTGSVVLCADQRPQATSGRYQSHCGPWRCVYVRD